MQAQFEQADEADLRAVRELFGGQVRQAVSGAAPIAPEILEFFYAAGVPVIEGWGMTETTGVGTVGTLDALQVRHRRASRCRASRSGSPMRTARS